MTLERWDPVCDGCAEARDYEGLMRQMSDQVPHETCALCGAVQSLPIYYYLH